VFVDPGATHHAMKGSRSPAIASGFHGLDRTDILREREFVMRRRYAGISGRADFATKAVALQRLALQCNNLPDDFTQRKNLQRRGDPVGSKGARRN
jgi:hypothetical protein